MQRWYYDLALAGTPEQVTALKSFVPTSQIVYGTDYPFANATVVAMLAQGFAALPFNESDQKAVAYGNATRLFPSFAAKCTCHG
jgi:6-methylsalicylate decarboxylase